MSYQCWSSKKYGHTKLTDYRKYYQSGVFEGEVAAFVHFRRYLLKVLRSLMHHVQRNGYSVCPKLEHSAIDIVYDMSDSARAKCTLLLILNLAKPEWIPVGCNDILVNHVVCFRRRENICTNHSDTNISYICQRTSILYKGWCYLFFPGKSKVSFLVSIISTCRNLNLIDVLEDDTSLDMYSILYEAISFKNINFVILEWNKHENCITFMGKYTAKSGWKKSL